MYRLIDLITESKEYPTSLGFFCSLRALSLVRSTISGADFIDCLEYIVCD